MHALVVTDSVHTTAAACDYLDSRLESDDRVSVIATAQPDTRDADDALNVANARLLGHAEIETERLVLDADEEVTSAIFGAVEERDPDIVVVGKHADGPNGDPSLGSAARALIEAATVPVVVVPVEE